MTDTADTQTTEPEEPSAPVPETPEQPSMRGWRERKSVHAHRLNATTSHKRWPEFDKRYNEESRLPPGEEVHLGGLVLVEAFTPSTVSALHKQLNKFPEDSPGKRQEWKAALAEGRSAAGAGGWTSLGCIRPPGEGGHFYAEADLPDGIDAAWIHLHFPTPSLTLVTATFTLSDQAGDLSALLRADYHSQATNVSVDVYGPLGWLRKHIPWARPSRYGVRHTRLGAERQKAQACESLISDHEEACWQWLTAKFPGTFSRSPAADRPTVRMLLTKEQIPFRDHRSYLRPIGLSTAIGIWRSAQPPHWAFTAQDGPLNHRFTATAAARISDADERSNRQFDAEAIWYLTQIYADTEYGVIVRWAVTCLLSHYADRLAVVRDQATRRRRIGRPVREAKELDRYLMTDGLDASTIIAEVQDAAASLHGLGHDIPHYAEDLTGYPQQVQKTQQPAELIPTLHDTLKSQANQLNRDIPATTAGIHASAELRQAIANTTVQRRLEILTIISIAIAVISLIIALKAAGPAHPAPARAPAHPSHTARTPPRTSRTATVRP